MLFFIEFASRVYKILESFFASFIMLEVYLLFSSFKGVLSANTLKFANFATYQSQGIILLKCYIKSA